MTRLALSRRHKRLREALADARRRNGYTQTHLARKLRRPQSFVSKFERGERRLDLIEFLDLARILQLDPSQVIREVERES